MKFSKNAFTLIELLVALTIIATLAALAMPAFTTAMESSKKAEAAGIIASIKTGLMQYRTEYGCWPLAIKDFTNDVGDIVLGENQWGELYRCLSAYTNSIGGYLAANGTTNNSRKLLFLELQNKIFSSSESSPFTGGETNPANVKNLLDPWNHPYQLVLDSNGDSKVNVPNLQSKNFETIETVSTIAIWSAGAYTNLPTKFIASWR